MTTGHYGVDAELSRDLGLSSALAIGVGTMIAAGIFTLSGLAVRNVGSAAILAFLLAAVVATFTALTYCEFASIYPKTGEGYLYARKTFPAPAAWFVGWCLLLGYTASCAFYIASLSTYFQEFVWHSPWQPLSGLVCLGLLGVLNVKGTKESGVFQIVVTAGKVVLLCWFVSGGLGGVSTEVLVERLSDDFAAIASTSAMVFITFFGFSAIAASAGEVQNPVRNIPRAIFLSMAIVTGLYTLVVLVMVGAGLTEYDEAAMGVAAEQFLGPIGGKVIVGGALFSMISASNASIMAGSRVAMAMSRFGHLPRRIGDISPRTRTPAVAVGLTTLMIAGFCLVLELEDLAHYADGVLLVALVLVNVALIAHRRRHPDLERPFRVPLVPFLPLAGIAANIALLVQVSHHRWPASLAVGSLVLGFAVFLVWKGTQPAEKELPGGPSTAVNLEPVGAKTGYRVLVPLAHPDTIDALIDVAAAIAKERGGEILALRVVQVPDQVAPVLDPALIDAEAAMIEQARARAEQQGVSVSGVIRIGHYVARAILEASREHQADLMVIGWKGYTSTARRILGETIDSVVHHASSDVLVVRRVGDRPVRRYLLPTAGGKHAAQAEQYVGSLLRGIGGTVTICSVVREGAAPEERAAREEILAESGSHLGEIPVLERKLLVGASVQAAIVEEAEDYDAIVIGAAGHSSYRQILFGSLPEEIAQKTSRSVVMVKRHDPVKAMVARVLG